MVLSSYCVGFSLIFLLVYFLICSDDDPDSKPREHAPRDNAIDKILQGVGHDNLLTNS